jgi:thiol-disulfide isomerase/thioredoxin
VTTIIEHPKFFHPEYLFSVIIASVGSNSYFTTFFLFTYYCVMKTFLASVLLLATLLSHGQSSKRTNIGLKVPSTRLFDTSGKLIKLNSFKGKVIYLDFWIPSCGPCIKMRAHEDSLLERLHELSLDTNIVMIKICDDCDFQQWKKMVASNNSKAINLLYKGGQYTLNRRFDASPYPTYHIVSKDFRYLGAEVAWPDNEDIDYCLFRALQNIPFKQSLAEAKLFNEKFNRGDTDLPDWYNQWRKNLQKIDGK